MATNYQGDDLDKMPLEEPALLQPSNKNIAANKEPTVASREEATSMKGKSPTATAKNHASLPQSKDPADLTELFPTLKLKKPEHERTDAAIPDQALVHATVKPGSFPQSDKNLLEEAKYVTRKEMQSFIEALTSIKPPYLKGAIINNYRNNMKIKCGAYILHHQYEHNPEKQIGEGAAGKVYKCQDSETKFEFAEKNIENNSTSLNQEPGILLECDCKNIIRLYGMMIDEKHIHIFLEYFGKPLNIYLQAAFCPQQKMVPPRISLLHTGAKISCQLLGACDYLHQKAVVHCDLHSGNLLSDEKGFVKICDFGSAKYIGDQFCTASRSYTPHIMPPTVLQVYLNYRDLGIKCYNSDVPEPENLLKMHNTSTNKHNILKKSHLNLASKLSHLASDQTDVQNDVKILIQKQTGLLTKQSQLLILQTHIQTNEKALFDELGAGPFEQDDELQKKYETVQKAQQELQQQQKRIKGEQESIQAELNNLQDQTTVPFQKLRDIADEHKTIQVKHEIIQETQAEILQKLVSLLDLQRSERKFKAINVSTELDTYPIGKLIIEILSEKAVKNKYIGVQELESKLADEGTWDSFVREQIPNDFQESHPELCQLFQDMMSFTPRTDTNKALKRLQTMGYYYQNSL